MPAVLGSRPDRLYEVRPQERVQRHTVDQMVVAPWLPIFDVPVPQLVDVMVEVLTCIDKPSSVEQVSKCPRSTSSTGFLCAPCSASRRRWNSWWTCQSLGYGVKCLQRGGRCTGGCRVRSTPLGTPSGMDRQPRAGYKSWAGLRRTSRQLSTSLRSSSSSTSSPSSISWMRLRFSSSTGCCRFQLLHRDRYAQYKLCRKPAFPRALLGSVVDMPDVCNDR